MFELWRNWIEAGRFAFDVQQVVAGRMMRFAMGGPQGAAEAQRMVLEKVTVVAAAQVAAGTALATGKSLATAAKRAATPIKRQVRANRKRLSRRK
jgi:hypothetical protein